MSARWNVSAGHFFFRYRNAILPGLIVLVVVSMQPRIMFGNPTFDRALVRLGMLLALGGEAVRLATIGFEYIDRGGRNQRVYASRLVRGGVYALTRNPMYVGNGLIAVGLTMVTGSPLTYILVIPFICFVYQAIVCAEEAYLRGQFQAEYDRYCADVNRFLPSVRGWRKAFAGMRYDWKRSVRQDLSTIAGLLMGLILLPLWRTLELWGVEAFKQEAPRVLLAALTAASLYGILAFLKKRKRLFY